MDESNPHHPNCAIKQFFPKHSSTTNQEKAAELFEQEAQRLKTLGHHSQIPQLLDYFSQDKRQYLVQEFIHLFNPGDWVSTEWNGLIGDDEQIIGQIRDRLKPGNRLYSFGVGSSTNRFLIERLAELGRGTAEVVPPNESAEVVAQEFFQEINNPVLTNIQVSWEGTGNAPEFYPQKVRDLFANQPLVVFGRKGDRTNGKLKISGIVAGGQPYETTLDVNFEEVRGNGAIAQLWGRARIKALMNQMYGRETPEVVEPD